MELPRLHGIVPPLPTPLRPDESVDVESLRKLVASHLRAGVHGLWVLGTTARFDLLPDKSQRLVAETVAQEASGQVPLVLNVSDLGTHRTLEHARLFDDLPYDYYTALPPWYLRMTQEEVSGYFRMLADELARPLVIYNAPWVCNQLSFEALRQLAEHPRIVGSKDVNCDPNRVLEWTQSERRSQDFAYLYGSDQIGPLTDLGSDGFVSALSNALPELAVATWEAARAGDLERSARLQSQFTRLGQGMTFGTMHACLDVACRHRGFLDSMLPKPLQALDEATAARVVELFDAVGVLPEPVDARV